METVVTRSLTDAKVKKKIAQPTMPNMIITIRKPRASFPPPNVSTSFNAVALTTEAPRNPKNFLDVERAVLSSVLAVRLGRIDAIGIFTTVYIKESPM